MEEQRVRVYATRVIIVSPSPSFGTVPTHFYSILTCLPNPLLLIQITLVSHGQQIVCHGQQIVRTWPAAPFIQFSEVFHSPSPTMILCFTPQSKRSLTMETKKSDLAANTHCFREKKSYFSYFQFLRCLTTKMGTYYRVPAFCCST